MLGTAHDHQALPDLDQINVHDHVLPNEAECPRCRGLMTKAFLADLEDDTGQFGFWALRCMQCGEIIDPVILRNRVTERRRVYKGRARL